MSSEAPLSCVPGIEWPGLPTAAGASMLAMQWQLERSQWWAPEVLREHQFRQIRALAGHALANVPWYREALRAAGLAGVSELDPETFRRWPILRKSEVRANESRLRAVRIPKEHGTLLETHTTGSTGEPLRVFQTQVTQFFAHALIVRDHLLHRRDFSRKFAAIRPSLESGSQRGWGVPNAMFATGPGCSLNASTDIDAQLDWLLQERPVYLLSHAVNLHALLLRSREKRKRPQGIRELIMYGDMPPPDLAKLARECWDVPVVLTYSCEEVASIASQCPGHEHYLVHAENLYLEVLRDDGTPCTPGEPGRVVVTALHNFAMPLIRYELGDFAEPGGPCPTGRGLPTLRRIVGRARNMLRDPEGRTHWPSFHGGMWLSIAPFQQVRLIQHTLAEIEVQFVIERELSDAEQRQLTAALGEELGYPFNFRLVRVAEIPRRKGEKFEEFVSLLPQD